MAEGFHLATLWDRVSAWLRDDLQIVLPVAGVFFFLPSVILSRFLPASAEAFTPGMLAPLLLMLLLQTAGQLVIFALLLDTGKPTVRQAIRQGAHRLVPAIGVQLMIFAIFCGLLLVGQILVMLFGGAAGKVAQADNAAMLRLAAMGLLIASPAILYLLARALVVFPVLMRESLAPLAALRRAFDLTRGHGWKIAGLILAATFLYFLIQIAFTAAFGSVFTVMGRLLGLEAVAALLTLLLVSALGTIATLLATGGIGFIYRDLAR